MHNRSLQKALLNAGSRVFARDDKEGTTLDFCTELGFCTALGLCTKLGRCTELGLCTALGLAWQLLFFAPVPRHHLFLVRHGEV